MKTPVRLNEAEWLIEPFYEIKSRANAWEFEAAPGVAAGMIEKWGALAVEWEATTPGTRVARLQRTCDLNLSATDRLCLRAAVAEDQRLTLKAVIDGEAQTVLDAVAGQNAFAEFEGAIQGRHLQHLEIWLTTASGDEGHVNLLWLLAIDAGARERHRRQQTVFDPAWPDLLHAETPPLVPSLGLWFGADDLPALRAKVATPPYAEAWRQIREQAAAHSDSAPEHGVREHLWRPNAGTPERYGHDLLPRPEPKQEIRPEAMRAGALAGLLEDDRDMARIAIRHALAAMHCTHWDDSFMMTRPGTRWDHRAFTAWSWLPDFLAAIDWAGACLTQAGRDLAARTLSAKVLPLVDFSLRKNVGMRGNNQGIFFAAAGVQTVCALDRLLPRGREGLDWYLNALRESTENYFLPDGGTHEGPAYFDGSCTNALEAFAMAARTIDAPAEDLLPPCLLGAHRYYRAMASTAFPGACVAVSDGGRVGRRVTQGAVPRLATLTGDPGLRHLTAALLEPEPDGTLPGAIPLVLHGPPDLPTPPRTGAFHPEVSGKSDAFMRSTAPLETPKGVTLTGQAPHLRPDEMPAPLTSAPVFDSLPDIGILCSCRPTPHGPVRLQLIGAKANAGHGHEDKGSFLLEAFGEELLVDRGTCFYGDSRSNLMKHALRHNLATPDDGTAPARQLNPVPEAIIPTGRGDETSFEASVDASSAWPHLAESCTRSVQSDTPLEFTLTDRIERHEIGTVSVHFQSRRPWKHADDHWFVQGNHARVAIRPDWAVDTWETREDLFDGNYIPVYRLTLRTTVATTFELRTKMRVETLQGGTL